MNEQKTKFQKEVQDKAFEHVSGYLGESEKNTFLHKYSYSCFCYAAEWQRNRVWHGLEEKAVLSKFVLLYDPDGGYMSPPSRWPFDDFKGFVEAMNKKHGANYTMWAYLEDIVPINLKD